MSLQHKHLYNKDSDLLKVYKRADEAAKYFSEVDDKLFSYHNVLDFCASSKKCIQDESTKKKQILFWTYNNIGNLFLQKNSYSFDFQNMTHAIEAYQNALIFSNTSENQTEILRKIRDIYHALEDEDGYFKTSSKLADLVDDTLKMQIFLNLANVARSKTEEAYFLEKALSFVSKEDVSFLTKCQNTLNLCSKLLDIYESTGKRLDVVRIKSIQEKTQNQIN